MFESVKTLDDRPNGLMYFASLLVSLAVHTAIIGAIVLVPLVFCSVLPENPIITFLMKTPDVPLPPLPPTPPPKIIPDGKLITIAGPPEGPPREIPKGVHPPIETLDPDDFRNMIRNIPGPPQGVGSRSAIDILLAGNSERLKLEVIKPLEKKPPLPVTSTLLQSRLIRRVDPVYPPLAIKARSSGIVKLEAIIDEEGNVTDIKVLSGPPLLVNAAVEAVRQWKYSPTILSGEPTRILATVEVGFILR
jgi:periplasmic protein TonB